ncbi:hypothetical protein D9M71_83550 [compost metagenome]
MGHGHFRQATHQQQCDERTDGIADEHARPGKADSEAATHEEPGADGAANGNHAHLRRSELALEPLLTGRDCGESSLVGHLVPRMSCRCGRRHSSCSGYSMITRSSLLSAVSARPTSSVERMLAWRRRTERSFAEPDCTT